MIVFICSIYYTNCCLTSRLSKLNQFCRYFRYDIDVAVNITIFVEYGIMFLHTHTHTQYPAPRQSNPFAFILIYRMIHSCFVLFLLIFAQNKLAIRLCYVVGFEINTVSKYAVRFHCRNASLRNKSIINVELLFIQIESAAAVNRT